MWSAAHPTCVNSGQCGFDRACIFQKDGRSYNPHDPGECENCYEIYVLHEDRGGEYSVHYVAGQVAPSYLEHKLRSELETDTSLEQLEERYKESHENWVREGKVNFTHVVKLKSLETGEVADPTFSCELDDTVCQGCFSSDTRTFSTRSPVTTTLDAMRNTDVLTLMLTSLIAASYMAAELHDARLCVIGSFNSNATSQWKCFFGLVYGIRRFIVTSGLMIAITNVVLYLGCDSMSTHSAQLPTGRRSIFQWVPYQVAVSG